MSPNPNKPDDVQAFRALVGASLTRNGAAFTLGRLHSAVVAGTIDSLTDEEAFRVLRAISRYLRDEE